MAGVWWGSPRLVAPNPLVSRWPRSGGAFSYTEEAFNGDERPEPRRLLDKHEAARHLIHSAIRMVVQMEDPFAIHIVFHAPHPIER
jgi:hypothetical protein